MFNKQRGYALTDVLFAVSLFMLIGGVVFYSTKIMIDRHYKALEIDNYSTAVFDGMTHAYMDNFAKSRCLSTPSETTIQALIDSEYLDERFIVDSWYQASTATIEYVENPNSVLPKEFVLTVKIPEKTGHYMSAKHAAGYTADNFLILKKMPDLKISIRMMTNMDSNGCAL